MSEVGSCGSQPACKSAGICRMVLGGAIIGAAVGWFLMVACVTHFDTDLSGAAEQLRAAGSAGDFKQAQQQIASAGGRLQEMKTALQTHVLLAGLGIVFLTIVGSLFMHSGSKVLRASLTPAGEAAVPSCCAGSSGVHDQPPVPGGPPSAT